MTAEVVEQGRPDRPRRGWAVGVTAVLLLAAAGYAATRPPDRDEARPAPSPAVTVAPTVAPGVPPLATYDPPDPADQTWALPPLGERTGIAYAMTAPTLRLLGVDSGDVADLAPRERFRWLVDPVARLGDGWLVIRRVRCGQRACPSEAYVLGDRRATRLGPAETAYPDGAGGVWLSGAAGDGGFRDPRWLERRTYDGTRTGPRTALRRDERLLGVTPLGPVVADPVEIGPPAYVVDPATRRRRVVVQAANVVAVSGPRIAWTSESCQIEPVERCALTVTDVVTGAEQTFDRVLGVVDEAAISPDGRYVAVTFFEARETVVVYDVRTGGPAPAPVGGVAAPPEAAALAWSPDSRWLVVAAAVSTVAADDSERQVAVWRPGLRTAYEGPPWVGAEGDALVVVAAR